MDAVYDFLRGRPTIYRDENIEFAEYRRHPMYQELMSQPETELTAAAVLIPILRRGDDLNLLFTKRPDYLKSHAGQISFPGGKVEPQDATVIATALRETDEEVGISATNIEILGQLSEVRTGTGFRVTPVIGFINEMVELRLDPNEVAAAFEAPLSYFLKPDHYRTERRTYKGRERAFFAIDYDGHYIWGLTAAITLNLRNILLHYSGIETSTKKGS